MTGRAGLPAVIRQVSPALLLVSLPCWLLLGAASLAPEALPLCASSHSMVTAALAFSTVYGVAATTAIATILWIVMVVAMTAPLLARPIAQVRLRSLVQRRDRAVGLFVAAYVLVWVASGALMLAALAAMESVAEATGVLPAALATVLAAIWQAAPLRQKALNRCHRVPNLAAFGLAADRSCIGFGLTQGGWCVATCLPLMVLAMMLPPLHLPAMLVLSVLLQLERLAPAQTPRWTLRILPGQPVARVIFKSLRWSTR